MPPRYHNSHPGNVIDETPVPMPDAYGSRYDTRYTEITQLHDNTLNTPNESVANVVDTFDEIIPNNVVSIIKPEYDIFQYTAVVSNDSTIALPFKAKSIRVDNLTNQWIFIPSLRLFVPPDWYGAIFTVNGLQQITIIFQAPSGLVNPAPTANTIVSIVAHFERLPDVAGVSRL